MRTKRTMANETRLLTQAVPTAHPTGPQRRVMKKINISTRSLVKNALLFSLLLLGTLAISTPARAACGVGDPAQYRRLLVTYYEDRSSTTTPFDSRRTLVHNFDGSEYYRTRLRGIVYYPCAAVYEKTSRFPAIIVNHGSEEEFEPSDKLWMIASYFVPQGYIVFVPFRRGHGDPNPPFPNNPTQISDKSTGIHVQDMIDDWTSGSPNYFHDTQCSDSSCYKAQLLKEQADEEIAAAIEYLKGRGDVKQDPVDPNNPNVPAQYRLGIMGISYGGAVTVFANRNSMGQRAAVAFSPGAQQWASEYCVIPFSPLSPICGTEFQRALIFAAGDADKPAYYLQGQWDYDTRATIDLAYAHAYLSPELQHHRGYMASIFPYRYPCDDDGNPNCSDEEFQSIHGGFFGDTAVWGPSVSNFLRRNNVD